MNTNKTVYMKSSLWLTALYCSVLTGIWIGCGPSKATGTEEKEAPLLEIVDSSVVQVSAPVVFDSVLYDQLVRSLSHNDTSEIWPVRESYPGIGAFLPFSRIIAFYGNLYSTRMGVLGALPPDEMLDSLQSEVRRWEAADSTMTAKPALHYIAVTAQRAPGKGGKYRLRMPDTQIQKVLELAKQIDALVFLDIQVGRSTLQEEIPLLREYLKLPHVHLGIDPEYSMKTASVPGEKLGTMDAVDINYASEYLAQLVVENNLPPKILVVHRFKTSMLTNYKQIEKRPEVQLIVHMDGFGRRELKLSSYKQTITNEPVQFAGFKLFYKNDTVDPKMPTIMQPDEILKLNPVPVYIQYQ
ncbi:MAG TPA: hypothetical protein PLR30_06170 [Saprospiraceae bacterium]|nr:hypothetical protein [Saprospiraceae bacterium]